MKLCTIKEYHLGTKLGQVRSVPVRLGARPENAVLFVYSSQPNLGKGTSAPVLSQVSGMRRLFPLTLMGWRG